MEIKAFMDGQGDDRDAAGAYHRTLSSAETITDPDTGEVVIKANHMCTPKRAAAVMKASEEDRAVRLLRSVPS